MKKWALKQSGFTIVELLIVVVVIAILAAITIVAYNGIKNRAVTSQVQAALEQANKKVLTYATLNSEMYPATLADAGISDTDSVSYQYSSDNTVSPRTYAITASNGPVGSTVFYISSTQNGINTGIAPGHNLIVWDKSNTSTAPISSLTNLVVDTSVYKDSTASIRFPAGIISKVLRTSPITVTSGQIITVKFWMLTDSNWNGTGNNSKIRFGASPGGTLLNACGYNGVKTVWTEVTCSYTATPANLTINISVGNDGTVGNIWLDNISLSVQ